jgi:galactonate dehydratase
LSRIGSRHLNLLLVTDPPRIENGELIVPAKPGWGADINEDAVKRHPPK